MKRTIKLFAYLTVLVVLINMYSCKKMLEIPLNPTDQLTTGQVFTDSVNVLNAISGIYDYFGVVEGFAGIHSGALSLYGGLSSDELIPLGSYPPVSGFREQFYNNTLLATNALLPAAFWEDAYQNMYSINAALEAVEPATGLSAAFKAQIKGELLTLRAMYYFHLVNVFGGVPLITGTDFMMNARIPRGSVEEGYELVVSDLEEARTLLNEEYPSEGHARPNVYAAKALLAKVYLYLENWQQAAELSGEVIESGLYSLENDLNNIFLNGSMEAIWQYPTAGGNYAQTSEAAIFVPFEGEVVPAFELTPFLLSAFEIDDQRRVNWVGELYDADNDRTYAYPYKYKNNDLWTAETQEDYMLLRLGEQYLIRAEARAHLGQYDDAVADINMIRARAGVPDRSFTTEEQLLADIMHERRIELFCEWGSRWFDLKRTGTADAVLGAIKEGWQPTDKVYPIPLQELRNNPALEQNEGYQ